MVRSPNCTRQGDVYLIGWDVFGHRTGGESVVGVRRIGSLSSLHKAGL